MYVMLFFIDFQVGYWNSSSPDPTQRLNINLTSHSQRNDEVIITKPSSQSWKDETLRVAAVLVRILNILIYFIYVSSVLYHYYLLAI